MTGANRRAFIKTGIAGTAAFVVGFRIPGCLRARISDSVVFKPNAWIRITPDEQITILVEKPEMGTGLRTSLPMLVAEELEADWTKIRVEEAPAVPDLYRDLGTGGSGGVGSSWMYLRKVGAQTREMLLTAAAQQWGVERKECRAENGAVWHRRTNRRLTYGQLVESASRLPSSNRTSTTSRCCA